MSFNDFNLPKALQQALDEKGISHPTLIQQRSFPVIMSGRDVMGIAQTGTGKTLAYLLPLLKMWKFSKERHPQIMIIVPTRELVVQVTDACKELTTMMNCITIGVHGGANLNKQAMEILQGLDIIVGTPGRVLDLAYHGTLQLRHIKKMVIDEVDEMLDQGFRPQLQAILDLASGKRQNLMFSATMTEDVLHIVDAYFEHPEIVEAAPSGTPLSNISQIWYPAVNFNTKINLLTWLMHQHKDFNKVVIFTGSRAFADKVYEKLCAEWGENINVIHGSKSQNHRFAVVKDFQEGRLTFLIASDIIARGIDISGVSHVINFDIPEEPGNYLHRIGRTGRADKQGMAISLVGDREKDSFDNICAYMHCTPEKQSLPEDIKVSDEWIIEELPVIKMKNQLAKIAVIDPGKSAFQEKKFRPQKKQMTGSQKKKIKIKKGKK